ncbi:unnamed protein product, partial [Laminaria digitata]
VGQGIRKKFGGEYYRGSVAFTHVLQKGGEVLYRVVYEDGDEEDLDYRGVWPLLSKKFQQQYQQRQQQLQLQRMQKQQPERYQQQ